MATIYIDDQPHPVNPQENLLHQCLSLGFNLPYFCWHPALGSVGACRQCAVKQFKDEHDRRGRIVMACVTPASEGTRISIDDPEAVRFRAGVIEGLMLNHPHDCPVCDEGGECHLQDMTVMTGHAHRRYRFEKRTFRNQNLGPFVNHEMNRCIQCYRCVRYYRDYAGGRDLNSFSIHDTVFFGRDKDGVLENEFSGNLVEICPTGVFTDKTLKHHYTRKWDQTFAPSICVHCGVGCNISAGERYGILRRIVNRYNHEVNGYFLCDRGRYGYEFVNSPRRVRKPMLHGSPVELVTALEFLRNTICAGRAIGIGSPRASLESNFALGTLVGPDRFFSGMADRERDLVALALNIYRHGPCPIPTLHEMELSDAVLVLGEDVTNTAPRIALTLRQAVRQRSFQIANRLKIPLWLDNGVRDAGQDQRSPLFVATSLATRLDDVATKVFRGAPEEIAQFGFAVAHALDGAAPGPEDAAASEIADALKQAQRPLIISGVSSGSEAVMHAAANVARACGAALYFIVPEANSMGSAIAESQPLSAAFDLVAGGHADTVIVLENDLYRRAPLADVEAFLKNIPHLIVLDSLLTPTAERAELLLPAATFAESAGTLVSAEARAQRFFAVFPPDGDVIESWRWLGDGRWSSLDDVSAEMSVQWPQLAPARDAAPSAKFRIVGAKIPREPHRASGRTAIFANIHVSEPKPPDDPDSALAFSMEGNEQKPPAALIPFFWSPGWNSIQATNTYQKEIGGPLRGGDPGVRLIEPPQSNTAPYFDAPGEPRQLEPGEWLIIPIHHIFGSDELSREAPAIAELAPEPYIAVGERTFAENSEVEISIDGQHFRLPVRIRTELPPHVAALPAGIPPLAGLSLPQRGTIGASK